jgi:hypothetical protein
MDRDRYEGYVAAKDAIAYEADGERATDVLGDLAEGLLLARDTREAETARERVPEILRSLVDDGDLSTLAAARLWGHLKACGPAMQWPPSWDRTQGQTHGWALRGH